MTTIKNIVFDLYGVLINPSDNYGILESVDLLRELKDHGYRVFGMTNLSLEGYSTVLTQCPFVRLLEDVIVSGREGVSKPNPRIYQILLERHKLLPEETLFIDDAAANVEAAQALHFHGHVFKSPQGLEAHLIKLGFFSDLENMKSDCCNDGGCSCHPS
jgi:2-haloacid dehalogenase